MKRPQAVVPVSAGIGAHGFTLTELAVVLFIVALLIGGLMMPLSAQNELRQRQETTNILDNSHDALLGFAAANGRLPCPDTDFDGIENTTTTIENNKPVPGKSTQAFSACALPEGGLPYATLGTSRVDGWFRDIRYRVTPEFTQTTIEWSGLNATGIRESVTPGISLSREGDITVMTRGDNPASPEIESKFVITLASKVPAVLMSFGKNGYGGHTETGITMPAPPASNVDETTNAFANSTTKFTRTFAPNNSNCSDTDEDKPYCEFDDMVVWLSPNILYNRMIAAGRLP